MPGYDYISAEKRRLERESLRASRAQTGDLTPRASSIEKAMADRVVAERSAVEQQEKERKELAQKLRIERARLKEGYLVDPKRMVVRSHMLGDPLAVFDVLIGNETVDWEAARHAAISIRNPQYSLKQFYEDMVRAFPELKLYMAYISDNDNYVPDVNSGTTASVEYRRTVGALFAVYWLMRVGVDGAEGFSYGVDEDWAPRGQPADANESGVLDTSRGTNHHTDKNMKKRKAFHDQTDWQKLMYLLVDALLLSVEDGQVEVNHQRTMAMLALTAFHDIMKVEALLPSVSADCESFQGYAAGVTINDHDQALGYVLDRFPQCLPAFYGLPREEQLSVAFTQAKMNFNHGWLVQAEAPPDALFSKFKMVIDTEGVEKADVAFYFVHWLTDLAGAHPSPLEGCVKFVLQFPQPVLASFINSFSVINELAVKTETQVFEDYMVKIWTETAARGIAIGPVPDGDHAVALMRLMIQCQTPKAQAAIVAGYSQASAADRAVLAEEMGRSGLPGQYYQRGCKRRGGPALLVYYSPAFMRSLVPLETPEALRMLAEVYRRARQLYPLRDDFGPCQTVSIRIDQLKEISAKEIVAAYENDEIWVLAKRNELEAVAERRPKAFLQDLQQSLSTIELEFGSHTAMELELV
eukprot:CAMPEP_0119311246 /NCGR_PEP_ID=MMETSP1333-20130426/21991_1 /TAXON_ID=418940 /ORGANISM="Scyphosphaera apsteinii, Strain RCC1455" /LENGTH=638 /DNA_ID=CAMNT_0007315581 /DNA_START=165 /DNA_END=2081 /DNA_ORIENTATION=+